MVYQIAKGKQLLFTKSHGVKLCPKSKLKVGNIIRNVSNRSLSCVEVVNYLLVQGLQNQGILCSREKSLKWLLSISVENFPPVSVQKFPPGLVG